MTRRSPDERAEREHEPPLDPWETGAPRGRAIYARRGRHRTSLHFLGLMEDPDLARHVVSLHNRLIDRP